MALMISRMFAMLREVEFEILYIIYIWSSSFYVRRHSMYALSSHICSYILFIYLLYRGMHLTGQRVEIKFM